MVKSSSKQGHNLGTTPSHGNPTSTSALNTELNNVARNTDDTAKARALVEAGADLTSTNGPHWRHTPLHQASYHGRLEMARTLVELGSPLDLHSNPCGRGKTGIPLELARGGGHHQIAQMLEQAMARPCLARRQTTVANSKADKKPAAGGGTWHTYTNIDMCFQGDAEIIHDWKRHHTISSLKKIVEEKGYSAVCVGSFGHAALKNFDYQLTAEHCKPSHGYTNELHIWFPDGAHAKPPKPAPAPRPNLPAGFTFHHGYGEATRKDQIGAISGIEGHCFGGDKFAWPLQWAAMIGDVGAIERLVAAGHDPNCKMDVWFDSEPLGWAASFGQCKAIEALCAAGADPGRPANLAGNTPLSDALREGHAAAIALLNEYLSGARPIGSKGGKGRPAGKAVGGGAASIVIDVSDAAEPPFDVSEDTPRSTFNDAKEGALRSKLRNQGSFSFSGKHDAHRSPRPPPTPRGLEALSTPSSQAAGMSHTERLRLMRERRQAAAEKLLHPDVLNPIPDHRRGLMTYQMKMACYGRSR